MTDRKRVLEQFEFQKDFMESTVKANIENYRKGWGTVTVKDSEGNVIPDAKISITQKSHEFKFGANLFMLDELETKEKNDAYKKAFAETFNMATLPFYWNATEPQKGMLRYDKNSPKMYRRPARDLCMEFCEANGIEPREHALAFERFFPIWLKGATVAETKKELTRRYAEISERYKDRIPTIEVTNEMFWATGKITPAFYDEPDYVEWCFKLAEQYFPANQLAINESTASVLCQNGRPTDKYYTCIENAMLKGARIDAIGMQFHIFSQKKEEYDRTRVQYNPQTLYQRMDMYSRLGKPLQITEVTLPAYDDTEEGEAIQAQLLENLYTIWFSHPNVDQIIYWNFVDGYAYVPSDDPEVIANSQGNMSIGENIFYGGLLRFDMSEKPALTTLKNLIHKVWHTEGDFATDVSGSAKFQGFYGDYDITVTAKGKRVSKRVKLYSKGKNEFEIVI